MAILGYTRVSTDKQADAGESLDVQQRQLDGWALMKNTQIDQVFVEAGVSGSIHIKDRPEGKRLLDIAQPGDTIVAVKLDRMFRSALDALQTVDALNDRGIRLILLDIGEVSEGMAKLLLTVAAAFAEAERDRIRDRIRTSKQHARAAGRYLGGKVPFGFRLDPSLGLVGHNEEQRAIASLRELCGRMSLRQARLQTIEQHGVYMSLATAARIRDSEATSPAL